MAGSKSGRRDGDAGRGSQKVWVDKLLPVLDLPTGHEKKPRDGPQVVDTDKPIRYSGDMGWQSTINHDDDQRPDLGTGSQPTEVGPFIGAVSTRDIAPRPLSSTGSPAQSAGGPVWCGPDVQPAACKDAFVVVGLAGADAPAGLWESGAPVATAERDAVTRSPVSPELFRAVVELLSAIVRRVGA